METCLIQLMKILTQNNFQVISIILNSAHSYQQKLKTSKNDMTNIKKIEASW